MTLLLLAGLMPPSAWAAEPVVLDVELTRNLGDGLFASGDAAGALQWYRITRWLDPDMEQLAEVQLRVGMGLEATGDPVGAADWYERVEGELTPVALFRSGVCRFRSGSPTRGSALLDQARSARPSLAAEAWLVESALWLEAGELEPAAEALLAAGPMEPRAAELGARALRRPHGASAALALGLSVVPGAGQAYTGAWGAGLRDLSLMALAGAATWGLLSHGEQGHAWASGMGGATMAFGGIGWTMSARGAWRRASRLHEQSRLDHLADLETRLHETFPELPLPPSPDQIYGL